MPRVCIITSLRIVLGTQIQADDLTYDLARLNIVTDLEPLLGITIACLPLFPPVFKKAFGAKDEPNSRNVLSSTLARLRLKSTKNAAFTRFNDSYLLTDVERSRTENQVTGTETHSVSLDDGSGGDQGIEASTIKVKQGWEVRSDKAV